MLENNIKNLIKILEESTIDEMEVSTFWGKQKIRIRKYSMITSEKNIDLIQNKSEKTISSIPDSYQIIEPVNEQPSVDLENKPASAKAPEESNAVCIKAPLVGTFYRSSKPGDPPFISEGDIIKEGQIICIIEAMKIFNEIESEFSGKVEKILIKDGTPIEYDQDLIIICPE